MNASRQSPRRFVSDRGLLPWLLALGALVAGAVWEWRDARQARADASVREAKSLVIASATLFDRYLRGLDQLASSVARNPSVAGLNRAQCDSLFSALLHDDSLLLNILLSAPDDTIRGTGLPTADEKPRLAMPYVQQVIASGAPAVSDLAVGPLTHKPAVMLGYPVRSNSGVVAVLAFGLDLSQLQAAFDVKPSISGAIVVLAHRSGLVLARSREADRYIGTTIAVPAELSSTPQILASTQVDADGVERVVASVGVNRGPWVMSAAVPSPAVAAGWPLSCPAVALVVSGLIALILLAVRSRRAAARDIASLRALAQAALRGNDPPFREEPRNARLAPLHDSIGTLADLLRQTRAELETAVHKEREARDMLELLQGHIVRQERLAAVGLLLSGVAHELNNPLQAIMGAAELLERRSDLLPDVGHEVLLIGTQAQRAAEIIRNLSRFGTPRTALPSAFDLVDVISEVVQLRRTDLDAARIGCEVRSDSSSKVFASFTEIEQVLLNFVINAEQSIKQANIAGGHIVIRTLDVDALVRLEVSDNGPGVQPEDEANIFQAFFTTKPLGEGTGLGLSVSRRIIESYGGTVSYRRNEQGGATFAFELPRLFE